MHKKLYPESGVELNPFISKNYDRMMNLGSAGFYSRFIKKVIARMDIRSDDHILDLGCGTGRNSKLMTKYLGENGRITGLDISPEMEQQFNENFRDDERVTIKNQRIDIPFDLGEKIRQGFYQFCDTRISP
jgi:ubiquinone/menaquinone biosynthesis C-methylase UbiE